MSELKCPFCNQKLEPIGTSGQFQCGTWGCDASFNFIATRDVWEYIDRTSEALEQSETCCSEWEKQALDYKAENIGLSDELECTRKALDVAVDVLENISSFYKSLILANPVSDINWDVVAENFAKHSDEALDQIKQITETKDVK